MNIELSSLIRRSGLSQSAVRKKIQSGHLSAVRSSLGGTWSSSDDVSSSAFRWILDWSVDRVLRGLVLNAACQTWLVELSGDVLAEETLIKVARMESVGPGTFTPFTGDSPTAPRT